MTPEQQEMLRAAILALDEERTTIQLDPNDVIALLRRVEQLEREAAFADKKRAQDVARIEELMRENEELRELLDESETLTDSDLRAGYRPA